MKPRKSSSFRSHASITAAFSVALLSHFAAPSAFAASLYWIGGSAAWNTTSLNWGTASVGPYDTTAWNNTTHATYIADLRSSSPQPNLTLGANITCGGVNSPYGGSGSVINAGSGPYTLTLGVTGNNTFSPFSGTTARSLTINAEIAGASGKNLNLTGGNLNLNGVNTFLGNIAMAASGVASTLTIGSAGSLGSGNYAGSISIVAGRNFNYSSSANQTLGGNITNAGTLTKGTSASSTLILNGTNTGAGAIAVNAGTLTFLKTAAKSSTGTVTVAANATLGLGVATSGSFFTSTDVDSLFAGTLSGVTNNATSNVGIDTTAGDFTYATSVSGSPTMGLAKLGANILTLSGTNTYTGATNIKTGTILMSGGGTLGTNSALIMSGGNLDLGTTSQTVGAVSVTAPAASGSTILNGSLTGISYAASNTTGDAIISANLLANGAAGFTKTGAGTVSLSGANTYTGGTAVNLGALTFLNTGAKPATGTVTVAAGATLGLGVATAGSFYISADVDSLFAGTLIGVTSDATSNVGIDTTQGDFTYETSVGGSPTRGLVKLGTNTLTLTGSNTFTGGLTITGGTLLLGSTGALNSTAGSENAVAFGAATTGTLALVGNNVVISNLTGSAVGPVVTNANGSSVANATLTVGNSLNLTGTYAGTLQDGTGGGTLALIKAGTGALTLSGASTYTGVTNVNAGTLTIANATALGTTNGNTVVASGARVFVATANLAVTEPFNIAGNGTDGTNGALHVGGNVTGVALSGAITLSGAATIQGDGGTGVTYSGGIDAGANTLTFGGSGTATVNTTGISGAGGGSIVKNSGGTLTLSAANTFTGSITLNLGTLNLNNSNAYTGTTTINGGTLSLGSASALGSTSGITLGGASVATLTSTTTGITIAAPITTADTGVTSTIAFSRATADIGTITLNGVIGGNGNVTFTTPNVNSGGNAQTINLGAAGTYAGSTTMTTGNINNATTIKNTSGAANVLPATTVLTMSGGSGTGSGRTVTFDLNGQDQELAGLTNITAADRNQRITSSTAATLTINNSADYTFGNNTIGANSGSGQLTGAIALTKKGAGTFTLASGIGHTHTGKTVVEAGILSVGNTNSLQNSAFDTTNSITGDATNGLQTTVTALTLGGLTGNKNLASVFETTAGGFSGVTALTLNPVTGASHSYSGGIADGAAGMTLTKNGAGTQTLSGTNTYTGATTVSAGTLALVGGSQSSPITVNNLASLGFTLGSGTTSTSTVTFDTGSSVTITGTPAPATSYTLMTTTATISGPLALNPLIPGFELQIDGTNTLKLVPAAAGGYAAWQTANSTLEAANLDHDNDGVSNGVEYFLGGTTNTTGFTSLPTVNTVGGLSVTFTKHASYTGSYTTDFTVETSATLAGPWATEIADPNPGFTVTFPTANEVKFTFPTPLGTKNFARLKVTGP